MQVFSERDFNQRGNASLVVSSQWPVREFLSGENNVMDVPELVYILFRPITPN